jgi:hypothetical protein
MRRPALRLPVVAALVVIALALVASPATARPRKSNRGGKNAPTTAPRIDRGDVASERGEGGPDRADRGERPEGPAGADPRATSDQPPGTGRRSGPTRIEFDDRLVQGQTNKANAIYLFERRESALRSLLKKRTHFHDAIDETLEEAKMR